MWRERTGWEVYGRFVEIAVILQRKYGGRIRDLVAIFNGKLDLVSLLLSLGADVHRRDPDGNSTLACAVLAAKPYPTERIVSIIQALRAAGAESAVRNKEGKSARDLARELGLRALEALL